MPLGVLLAVCLPYNLYPRPATFILQHLFVLLAWQPDKNLENSVSNPTKGPCLTTSTSGWPRLLPPTLLECFGISASKLEAASNLAAAILIACFTRPLRYIKNSAVRFFQQDECRTFAFKSFLRTTPGACILLKHPSYRVTHSSSGLTMPQDSRKSYAQVLDCVLV